MSAATAGETAGETARHSTATLVLSVCAGIVAAATLGVVAVEQERSQAERAFVTAATEHARFVGRVGHVLDSQVQMFEDGSARVDVFEVRGSSLVRRSSLVVCVRGALCDR